MKLNDFAYDVLIPSDCSSLYRITSIIQSQISRDMTKPTKWLCSQRRLRSAWASAQSDQGRRCPHEESLGPYLPIKRTAKTLIRLGGCQTGRMPRLIWVFAGRTVTLLVLSCRGSNAVHIRSYTIIITYWLALNDFLLNKTFQNTRKLL